MAVDAASASPLTALSPLDGRYASRVDRLRPLLSEAGFMAHRVRVELAWLVRLADAGFAELAPFSAATRGWIAGLLKTFGNDDARLWAALGRVGARVPVYASVHHVVPPKAAEAWLTRLLDKNWGAVASAPHAAVQLARVTGDRARDVSEKLRKDVAARLVASGAKEAWVQAVRELVEIGEEERVAILGEGLPIGLRLSD